MKKIRHILFHYRLVSIYLLKKYDESYLPKKLDRVDEAGNLYFDGGIFPWKLADDFAEDKRWGYPKWKVALGKLTGKGK